MNELIVRLLNENPDALRGLRLTGTVPLREDVVNEVLATALASLQAPPDTASDTPPPSPAAGIDPRRFAPHLRSARIAFRDGNAVLDFEVRVD